MDALDLKWLSYNATASSDSRLRDAMSSGNTTLIFAAAVGTLLIITATRAIGTVSKGWAIRRLFAKLRREGKPMPPWNPVLGNLLAAKDCSDGLPPNAASTYILDQLTRRYGDKGAFYLDTWPMTRAMIIVTDRNMANQTTSHSFTGSEKPYNLIDWFLPISGGHNLFTQNGEEWKHDHSMFLPAFNNGNLDAAMPVVVEQLLIYRDKLRAKAKEGDQFRLEPLTLAFMNDVIGKIVFNAELGAQSKPHPLTDRMLRQLALKFGIYNIMKNLARLSPTNWFYVWNNNRLLNRHIKDQVAKRVEAYQSSKAEDDQEQFKSILDIALEFYFSDAQRRASNKVDAKFLEKLYAQMRMFFFAGYDSTASTMVYCCFTVWKHPEVLAKLRAEHDSVFGGNLAACPDMIAENPGILNSLPYTNAVIKETMRLFPVAGGFREGCRDLVLKAGDGTLFPTEHCAVQINHITIQRNPKYWLRPNEFIPERWLVEPGHELYPVKGAWRPFEWGARNCTGQALVVKECKVFLAVLAREFDIHEAYADIDGDKKRDLSYVFGENVYLVEAGAAHPRDLYPCRVSLSNYTPGV